MKTVYVVLAGLLFSGCVTSRPVSLPNGVQGLAISCDGSTSSMAECMNRAAKACNGPYKIIERDEKLGANAMAVAVERRTLIVQCGESQ